MSRLLKYFTSAASSARSSGWARMKVLSGFRRLSGSPGKGINKIKGIKQIKEREG